MRCDGKRASKEFIAVLWNDKLTIMCSDAVAAVDAEHDESLRLYGVYYIYYKLSSIPCGEQLEQHCLILFLIRENKPNNTNTEKQRESPSVPPRALMTP